MAKPEQNVKSDLDAKINEAEVCLSMGLYDEALSIFNQVIDEYPDIEEDKKKTITEKIDSIKKELADQEVSEAGSVSTEEISMLKKSLSGQEDAPAIIDSASAFKDLGLFEEALAEYEKILVLDHPPESVIPGYCRLSAQIIFSQ
jgi:tetratricopeptide (TPR) repeat protein